MPPIVHKLKVYMLFLLALPVVAKSQFSGGIGQGNMFAGTTSAALGSNFYTGGSDDGFVLSAIPSQNLGMNFFKGGVDDGMTTAAITNQNLGSNFFKGGADDGWALSGATSQPIGSNFFKGGIDDGIATAAVTDVNLGANFFKGGADDGWAMAFVANTPLPVTLLNFTAVWQNADVITTWTTTTESNTAYFEIERSIDGNHFTRAGTTNAAGNSSTEKIYSFTDVAVKTQLTSLPSKLFYRLKTVDRDGQIQYSAIVVLNVKQNEALYSLYPNPARNQFTIEYTGLPIQYTLQLLNSAGQSILQKNVVAQKEVINVSAIANGIYYVLIIDKTSKSTQSFKIIIKH